MQHFHPLKVAAVQTHIGGAAKTLQFFLPAELRDTFRWKAGQHITVRFDLEGTEARRSYSISSSYEAGGPLDITVKRVEGGLVSNYINDNIDEGAVIEVMPPFGSFFLKPDTENRRTYYCFVAGSGITPVFSMIKTVLAAEPHSAVNLLYGNQNDKTVIFQQALEELQSEFGQRLNVLHVLSKPSMWSGFKPWCTGRIDQAVVEKLFSEHPPYAQDVQYYICGPAGMIQSVSAALMNLDVPKSRIQFESFGASVAVPTHSIEGCDADVTVQLDGKQHSVKVTADQTLLQAMRTAGLSPPFSCESGVCGACRAVVVDGSVRMRSHMALDDEDIDSGVVLTCQSVAASALLSVRFV